MRLARKIRWTLSIGKSRWVKSFRSAFGLIDIFRASIQRKPFVVDVDIQNTHAPGRQ